MRKVLAALLISAVACGCSVQSQQADIVRSVLPGGGDASADGFAWKMSFGGIESIVFAVVVEDGIVFANRDGLQIGFDGWDVVLVTGLPGATGNIRVRKEQAAGGDRSHNFAAIDTIEVSCGAPRRAGSGWATTCESRVDGTTIKFRQLVDLDASGSIARIESVLVPGAAPLVLEPFGTGAK